MIHYCTVIFIVYIYIYSLAPVIYIYIYSLYILLTHSKCPRDPLVENPRYTLFTQAPKHPGRYVCVMSHSHNGAFFQYTFLICVCVSLPYCPSVFLYRWHAMINIDSIVHEIHENCVPCVSVVFQEPTAQWNGWHHLLFFTCHVSVSSGFHLTQSHNNAISLCHIARRNFFIKVRH